MNLRLSKTGVAPYDFVSSGDPIAGIPGDRSNTLQIDSILLDNTGAPANKESASLQAYLVAQQFNYENISLAVIPWTVKNLSFASADNSININAGAFPDILPGQTITISGAANGANNGTFTVVSRAAQKITLSGGTLVNAGAGTEIVIAHTGIAVQIAATAGGSYGASLSPANMNALSVDQVSNIFFRAQAANNGSVPTGRYGFFMLDISATELAS